MATQKFAERLMAWFQAAQRKLPWRQTPRNPYHVWLSEIMLQQTQVATVVPYFEKWLNRFPTLRDFADAPLVDVLKHWEGLGYYARARNFHKAAHIVVHAHAGALPRTVEGLLKLPGIGKYTAGAIASIAFDQRAAVLDGNVKRVYARVHALRTPNDAELWEIAESHLPPDQVGTFNEALMELGATMCTPRAPNCDQCPVQSHCLGYQSGLPESFPQRRARAQTPHYDVTTAVLSDATGTLLMGLRPQNGLLGGLWEFISSDFRGEPISVSDMIRHRTGIQICDDQVQKLGSVKHAFTHFKITRTVWSVTVNLVGDQIAISKSPASGYAELRWVTPSEIAMLALTRSDQKILELYEKSYLPTRVETR